MATNRAPETAGNCLIYKPLQPKCFLRNVRKRSSVARTGPLIKALSRTVDQHQVLGSHNCHNSARHPKSRNAKTPMPKAQETKSKPSKRACRHGFYNLSRSLLLRWSRQACVSILDMRSFSVAGTALLRIISGLMA